MEKSREIIKRLKDERRDVDAQLSEARAQMEQRLSDSQQNLESEKDEEIKELRRGKVEALQVMQVSERRETTSLSFCNVLLTFGIFCNRTVWKRG